MIDEHGGAIEYDLMTRVGETLDGIGVRIPWRAFSHFVAHLDASSAYLREVAPDAPDEYCKYGEFTGTMVGVTCADRMKHEKYADFDFFEYIADEAKGVE